MALGNTPVTAVDVGVGEASTGNTYSGAAPRGSKCVMSSPSPDAQGGALLPEVPTDTGEEFYRSSKAKEAHVIRCLD